MARMRFFGGVADGETRDVEDGMFWYKIPILEPIEAKRLNVGTLLGMAPIAIEYELRRYAFDDPHWGVRVRTAFFVHGEEGEERAKKETETIIARAVIAYILRRSPMTQAEEHYCLEHDNKWISAASPIFGHCRCFKGEEAHG